MFKLITMSLLFLEISTSLVCKILKSIWLSYESGNQSVTTYPSLFVFKVLQCSASLINNYSAESHVLLSWRQWHPTAVLLPGKSHGLRSLVGSAVHGVARSQTRLSDFTFTFHFHVLEEEMATHSSVLAWRIPWTGEPGGLPSMGSHRVGHGWGDLAAVAAAWNLGHSNNFT